MDMSMDSAPGIVGRSAAIQRALSDVSVVAPATTPVLIQGETGTGKELFARAVHDNGVRAKRPFVVLNCAAIAAGLVESELFGHERGAFTGAVQRHTGHLVRANGGTLFLDEIGELPLDLQPKLLRVLQQGEVTPVGGTGTRRVDVRFVAATHRDLAAEVTAGRFREDLYYRLSVFPLYVPPLRERLEDIKDIADAFLVRLGARLDRTFAPLTEPQVRALQRHSWPGNVRELEGVLERAALFCRDGVLSLDRAMMPPSRACASPLSMASPHTSGAQATSLATSMNDDDAAERVLRAEEIVALERDNILRALRRTGYRVSGPDGAARLLGVPPSTLNSRMSALGIARPGHRARPSTSAPGPLFGAFASA